MDNNIRENQPTNKLSVKNKVFLLSSLLTIALVTLTTITELKRWKSLSESYIDSKGITLVRTISPLIKNYIENNDTVKITKLAKALTSLEIQNNDIISVQLSDSNKKKLAESAPNIAYKKNAYFHLPSTVVVENPIINIENDETIGFIQIVFSNEYFAVKTNEVMNIAFIALLMGFGFSFYLSKIVANHIEKPTAKFIKALNKLADGKPIDDIDVESSPECQNMTEAITNLSNKLSMNNQELKNQNVILDRKVFEMTALKQINHSLSFIHDIDSIYSKLVENTINILSGIQCCVLMTVDEAKNEFEYRIVKGLKTDGYEEGQRIAIDSTIASKAYQTGETLLFNETKNKKREISNEEESKSVDVAPTIERSFYAPIIVKGKVVAVLHGKDKLINEDFTESDIRIIEGIINESSIALKSCLMWQDLHRKVIELNSLHEIGKNLGQVLDINKLLDLILDQTSKVFGGLKHSSVMLYDEETELLNVKLYKGENSNRQMKPIRSGEGIAGKVFQRGEPIIINDMLTSDNDSADSGSSSICVPLKVKEKCLGVLSITDKLSGEPFDKSDLDMMVTLASQISISLNNARLYEDLEASYLSAVRALANSIDAKDTYTRGHSERVAKYSIEIGKKMNLSDQELKNLYVGALLHDIGKIGIPEAIINKTDKLTNEEYQEIKTHPSRGAMIIEPAKFLKEKVPLIKYHHERYDGKGYPEGLKGDEIPLMARIICCADSFDAMTSKRAYRDTMPLDFARKEMVRCSETQFDPRIVNIFLEVLADEAKITEIRNS